jgi:hypothetical protein
MESSTLLENVAPEKVFYFCNGKTASNLKELHAEITNLSEDEFQKHCNNEKDDFANWISEALMIPQLAQRLRNKSKLDYMKALYSKLNTTTQSENIPHTISAISKSSSKRVNLKKKAHHISKTAKIKSTSKSNSELNLKKHTTGKQQKNTNSKQQKKTTSTANKHQRKHTNTANKHRKMPANNANEHQKKAIKAKSSKKATHEKVTHEKAHTATTKTAITAEKKPQHTKAIIHSSPKKHSQQKKSENKKIKPAENIQPPENIAQKLTSNLDIVHHQINRIAKNKITRLEKLFDKRAEDISSTNIKKIKAKIDKEKEDFRAIATDVMNREFDKILSKDEQLSKIISKYQKLINESAENSQKKHADFVEKFTAELDHIKSNELKSTESLLQKKVAENLKKQQETMIEELSKTLNEKKLILENLERKFAEKEKNFDTVSQKKLKEHIAKEENELSSKYLKYYNNILHLKMDVENELKGMQKQLTNTALAKYHETVDKEFKEMLDKQQKSLSGHISNVSLHAESKINSEFTEILSKYKKSIEDEYAKTTTEYAKLREKFIEEIKNEKENGFSKIKESMQKEISSSLVRQRELLDNELAKAVKLNHQFVEQFKKEIVEMNKRLTEAENRMISQVYSKNKDIMKEEFDKKIALVKTVVEELDPKNKNSKFLVDLKTEIHSLVKDAVKNEFSELVSKERKELEVQLKKAETNNKELEKKLEDALSKKAEVLVNNLSNDANKRFTELINLHKVKFGEEIAKAMKTNEHMEGRKKEIFDKTNALVENINHYSTTKLKNLEKQHDKHLKKVTALTNLISETKDALTEVKSLKAELNSEKKNTSKENKEYAQLIAELTQLRDNLSKEKTWISMYRAKVNIYLLVRRCTDFVKLNDVHNAKITYNKIAEAYAKIPFEKSDKEEIYNVAFKLSKEIQELTTSTKN